MVVESARIEGKDGGKDLQGPKQTAGCGLSVRGWLSGKAPEERRSCFWVCQMICQVKDNRADMQGLHMQFSW